MNKMVIIATAMTLSALCISCSDEMKPDSPDKCLQREIFNECLKTVPKGPNNVRYNDWSEVVEQCGVQARRMSIRPVTQIKPECR